MLKKICFAFFLSIVFSHVYAINDQSVVDTARIAEPQEKRKNTLINRMFFGHIDRTHERKLDFSFVVAPSYTQEGSFGIGGIASGLYRLDRSDSIMQPSDISISGNASIKGFFALNATGNNLFRGNKSRLSYQIGFVRQPLHFWGISYEQCKANPQSEYTRQGILLNAEYVHKLPCQFYAGVSLDVRYANIIQIDNIEYLQGQNQKSFLTGFGVSLQYDTRDFIPTPSRGVYIALKGIYYPKSFSNYKRSFFSTTFIADAYLKIWQGGILAADFYAKLNGYDMPWALKEELGGGKRMRGYYRGRFTDNNQMTLQTELRQHVWKRLGVVAWVGGGSVFPSFKKFNFSQILPNYGLGIRFEFKHNVNARLDYGFGKGTSGFVMNISEAF